MNSIVVFFARRSTGEFLSRQTLLCHECGQHATKFHLKGHRHVSFCIVLTIRGFSAVNRDSIVNALKTPIFMKERNERFDARAEIILQHCSASSTVVLRLQLRMNSNGCGYLLQCAAQNLNFEDQNEFISVCTIKVVA